MGLKSWPGRSLARMGVCAATAASAALLAGTSALAQDENLPRVGDPGLRDPRVEASVPNISGVWFTPGYNRRASPADGSPTPFLPWAAEWFEKREAAEKAGSPLFDPTAACLPSGIPRLIIAPYPIEIVQTPDTVVILHETHNLFRLIHMNGKHPENPKPTYMGHSVGHWEGDTLVVDTVGLAPHTQIDEAGTLHTGELRVVERIRVVDPTTMENEFTIHDPKAFSKPWTAKRIFKWRPEVRLMEYVCEENNRNAPDETGVLRNF